MAYKLLVADDEYWAREKLRMMIDWGRYGIEFLEPACDGDEVLERIGTDHPDILITDINMPGLSGADLLEQLAGSHPDMVTLVVSGYDTFSYVKRTMRSGAINYLLKPVNKIELISAVSEALEILHDRQVKTAEEARQREQLLWTSSLLQDRELSWLLDNQVDTPPALSMNVPLNVSGYSVILMKIHDMTHIMGEYHQDINKLSYAVKSRLRALPNMESAVIFNHFSRANEFILLADRAEERSMEAARRYMDLLGSLANSPVTVVLSAQSYALDSVRTGYLWAVSQLRRRRYIQQSAILPPDFPERQPDDDTLQWTEEAAHRLGVYLGSSNQKKVEQTLLEKTGLWDAQRRQVSCGAVSRLISQMNNALQAGYLQSAAPDDAAAVANLVEEVARSVETLDFERLRARENELIDAVLSKSPVEQTHSMRDIVRQVQKDIDAHYYTPLTLTSLAEKYYVERSYLSRCFKQETGENLMPYLTRRRIERAMEQIREGKTGLTEISFLVGYDDYTYFSRVFKKIAGVSPREYKDRCLAGQGGAP